MIAVLDRTNDTIADRVADLARRAIDNQGSGKQPITKPIGNDDDLRACGLSSIGLVNLMLAVEAEFDVKIPERDMTPANFRSIARIAELVRDLSSQPDAGE
jgi:acyl carrier protein